MKSHTRSSPWCLGTLIFALVAIQVATQQQQRQKHHQTSDKKLGLAPHERPSCQLPPTNSANVAITSSQRRRQALQQQQQQQQQQHANTDTQHQHQNQDSGAKLDGSLGNSAANATYYNEPTISAPNVVSLPQATNITGGSAYQRQTLHLNSRRATETTEKLRQLRQLLVSNNYDAYFVTPNDEHGSEYVSDYDRRLKFITGFTGSNGYALILLDKAVFFTDGRYTLQADQELDCNWWLVVGRDPLESVHLWLKQNQLRQLKVATDARLLSLEAFDYLDAHLRKMDSEFVLISQDLIDIIWSNHESSPARQPASREPLLVHPPEFTGNVSWQEKVLRLANLMSSAKYEARHYVIGQLDNIAWLLNLRGNDIPMSPLFKAFLVVSITTAAGPQQQEQLLISTSTTTKASGAPVVTVTSIDQLFAASQTTASSAAAAATGEQINLSTPQVTQFQVNRLIKLTLYIDMNKISQPIREYLRAGGNGSLVIAPSGGGGGGGGDEDPSTATLVTSKIVVELKDYDVFIMDFRDRFTSVQRQQQSGRLLLDAEANVAVHVLAKNYEDRLILMEPLITRLKAVKSEAEVQAMRQAHWRDSLAISMLLAQLDLDIGRTTAGGGGGGGHNPRWTEVGAARELEFYRSLMDYNRGQSFDTISAYGPNGAIVHYKPNVEDSYYIGNQSTYLLDSGGQYLDGTTDITRTVHFGRPSEHQRDTYTRVLMGSIDMMSLVFEQSEGAGYKLSDMPARRHLLEVGLDYQHGTGHGIGLFSMVHEAPWLIQHYAKSAQPSQQQQQQQKTSSSSSSSSLVNNQHLVYTEPLDMKENMFTSVEPGYYKADDFGIRLENIVVTRRVGQNSSLLRFEPLSLVPFEPKLVRFELLSNKQKAWLNSYNLMVRLRMTQQINNYLAKLKNQEALPSLSSRAAPPVTTSSRLYRQQQQQQNNNTSNSMMNTVDIVSAGRLNYLRLEPAKFQALLEQTHRWIMRKTQLIPLDEVRSVTNANKFRQDTSTSGGGSMAQASQQVDQRASADEWSALSSDPTGKRLMLAYMSAAPFNDQEAGQAAAQLAGRAGSSSNQQQGEQDSAGGGGGNKLATPATATQAPDTHKGIKCVGVECDLWLLEALNSLQNQQQQQHQQPPDKRKSDSNSSSSGGGGWTSLDDDQLDNQSTSSNIGGQTRDESSRLEQLMDFFKLDGAINGPANKFSDLLGSMWPLWSFGLLLVLQLIIMGYVCRERRSKGAPTRQGRFGGGRRRSAPTTGPATIDPTAAATAAAAASMAAPNELASLTSTAGPAPTLIGQQQHPTTSMGLPDGCSSIQI